MNFIPLWMLGPAFGFTLPLKRSDVKPKMGGEAKRELRAARKRQRQARRHQ